VETATEQRYDPGRARLRLAPDELLVLGQLAAGTPVDGELTAALDRLRAAGLTDGTSLLPDAAELVGVFARPDLLLDVETSSPWGLISHGVAVSGGLCWTMECWPGTDLAEYVPVEPALLVPTLARMVGLRRTPQPSFGVTALPDTLDAPLGALDAALDALGRADPTEPGAGRRAVDAVLAGAGVPDRSALAAVLADRRSAWRVTASAPGREPAGVAVLDAGPSGLWRRELPAGPIGPEPPGPDVPLRLVRTTAGQVWRDLTALLHAPA
jgi:hypothetical protein